MAPLRFLNAKLKTLAVFGPDAVTVTAGVPTLASTVAVGVPKPAAAPAAPAGPCGPVAPVAPLGIPNVNLFADASHATVGAVPAPRAVAATLRFAPAIYPGSFVSWDNFVRLPLCQNV